MSEPIDSTSVPASPSGNVLLSQLERTNSSQNLPIYHAHGNSNSNTPLVGSSVTSPIATARDSITSGMITPVGSIPNTISRNSEPTPLTSPNPSIAIYSPTLRELQPSFSSTLYNTYESKEDETGYKGSILTFVVKNLLHEFRDQSRRKIERVLNFPVEDTLPLYDIDTPFRNFLNCLSELSKHCLTLILRWFYNWRTDKFHIDVTTIMSQAIRIKVEKRKGGVAIIEERYQMCIDYLFATVALTVLNTALSRENLEEALATQIELLAFEHFKPRQKEQSAAIEQRKQVGDLYAQILGTLSKYRMKHITTVFFKEVTPIISSSNAVKAFGLIHGIRFVKLKIKSAHSLAYSLQFVHGFWGLFKQAKSTEVKQALTDCYVLVQKAGIENILNNETKSTLNYFDWYSTFRNNYDSLEPKKVRKSKKDMTVYYPLLVTHLCLCDKDFFLSNMMNLLDMLFKAVPKMREASIDLIHLLVEVYLVKFAEPNDDKLHVIVNQLFPAKKLILPERDCLEHYAEFICTLSKAKMEFAMVSVIFELFRVENLTSLSPEILMRVIIALRSIIIISNSIDYKNVTRSQKILKNTLKRKSRDQSSAATLGKQLEHYLAQTSLFVSNLLPLLDTMFASPAGKIEQNVKLAYEILTLILQCIPFLFPVKFTQMDVILILAKYLIHADEGIRDAASDTFSRIMECRPDLRSTVIVGLSNFALTIPDMNHTLEHFVIYKLNQLLIQWIDLVKKSAPPPPVEERKPAEVPHTGPLSEIKEQQHVISLFSRAEENKEKRLITHRIEALALVFLCCPYTKIRKLCMEMLDNIRSLDRLNREHESYEEIRIKDIMDESGPDVISNMRQDPSFQLTTDATVEEIAIAAKVNTDAQTLWTGCYGELLRYFLEFAQDPVRIAWDMVCSRINGVQPEENKDNNEARLLWWRNYMIFACATVPLTTEPSEARKKSGPSSARELFAIITQYLKSSVDQQRQAATMALERTNPAVYEVFFDAMKPIEQEFTKKTKGLKRKDRDRLRSVVTLIYSSIAERLHSQTLKNNEFLRKTFLTFIQDTLQYLTEPGHDFIWDNLQYVRYHLCTIVAKIAYELQFSNELFDKNLRRDLFYLFAKWSKGEDLLAEEVNKKKLSAILAQMKDHEKAGYETMISEQTIVLQHSACLAISALLLGTCWDNSASDANSATFSWINNMLQQNDKLKRIGRNALYSFLQGNLDSPGFLRIVVNQCYSPKMAVAKGYFLTLVELFRDKDFQCPFPVLVNLILFKAGDKSAIIRKFAIQLLQLATSQDNLPFEEVEDDDVSEHEWIVYEYPLSLDSSLHDTFLRAQYNLSCMLANDRPSIAYDLFHDIVIRLNMVGDAAQKQVLTYIIPWIEKMDLNEIPETKMKILLENFFLITLKHGDEHPHQIEQIWATLGDKHENIAPLFKYLLDVGFKKQNPNFVPLAKKISIYVGRVSSQATVDALVTELSSLTTEKVTSSDNSNTPRTIKQSKNSQNLWTMENGMTFSALMPVNRSAPMIGKGHLALTLLAEISFEIGEEFRVHLPTILQLVFLGFDNFQLLVFEHSRMLLLNLIHSLVIEVVDDPEVLIQAQDLEDLLKSKEGKPLWPNEDISIDRPTIPSAQELTSLVTKTIQVLYDADLHERWADEALAWALSCPSSHLIARSYQIYRALKPTIHREGLIDVLRALFRYITDTENESVGLSLEIIYTLQVMVKELDPQKLILFTQIFWGAVALLHTDYEQHFAEATKLLSKLVDVIDFKDRSVQNVFLASIPAFEPPFIGVQPLLLKGLLSHVAEESTIMLLSKLTLLPCDDIFHPQPNRFLANMLALLPWLCHHIKSPASHYCFQVASNLAQASSAQGHSKISKVYSKFAAQNYDSVNSFLNDLKKPLKELIGTKHVVYTFTFLFTLLEEGPPFYHPVLLPIISNTLSACIDVCNDNMLFRNKIPQWFGSLMSFINGPLANEVFQIFNAGISKQDNNNLPLESLVVSGQSVISAPLILGSRQEFTNKPKMGTKQASNSLAKVLESCKYSSSSERGSISHVISPNFWSKFFSTEDLKRKNSASTEELEDTEDYEEDDNEDRLKHLSKRLMVEDSEDESEIAMDKNQAQNNDKYKFQPPSQFGRFPTFSDFDAILDFSEFDESDNHDKDHSETPAELSKYAFESGGSMVIKDSPYSGGSMVVKENPYSGGSMVVKDSPYSGGSMVVKDSHYSGGSMVVKDSHYSGGSMVVKDSPYSGGSMIVKDNPYSGGSMIVKDSPYTGGSMVVKENPYSGGSMIVKESPYSGGSMIVHKDNEQFGSMIIHKEDESDSEEEPNNFGSMIIHKEE